MKKTIAIQLNAEQHKKFKILCIKNDISLSEGFRRLVDTALFKNEIEYYEDGSLEPDGTEAVRNGIDDVEGL